MAMKRIFAVISIGFFVFHVLALGMPTGDLDKNGKIDLQDAITAVRGLQNLAQIDSNQMASNTSLKRHLGKAFKVFRAIAGEETQVQKPEQETVSSSPLNMAIQPQFYYTHVENIWIMTSNDPFNYQSIDLDLTPPPPQFAC